MRFTIGIIISLCMALATTNSIYAQASNHLNFEGMPIGHSLSSLVSKLSAVGFKKLEEGNGKVVMQGRYDNIPNCKIIAIATPKSGKAYAVKAIVDKSASWEQLQKTFENRLQRLTSQLGKPREYSAAFKGKQPKGDKAALKALQQGKCDYRALYKEPKGEILLTIDYAGDCGEVVVTFLDGRNTALAKAEANEGE